MEIQLLYFGRPRERLGVDSECVDIPDTVTTLSGLLDWLRSRGDAWTEELDAQRVRCAVNQGMADLSTTIAAQDEVAIFSPISGG